MRQYIMLGIIAAGVLMLAVFLFLSFKSKKVSKETKAEKSLFTELEERPRVFPEDYKTEVLIERDYRSGGKSMVKEPEEEHDFNLGERITHTKNKGAYDEDIYMKEVDDYHNKMEMSEVSDDRSDDKSDDQAVDTAYNQAVDKAVDKVCEQTEEYVIENCTIKSLSVNEKMLKKLNLKSCSIENIYLVPCNESGGEESL